MITRAPLRVVGQHKVKCTWTVGLSGGLVEMLCGGSGSDLHRNGPLGKSVVDSSAESSCASSMGDLLLYTTPVGISGSPEFDAVGVLVVSHIPIWLVNW